MLREGRQRKKRGREGKPRAVLLGPTEEAVLLLSLLGPGCLTEKALLLLGL